MTRHFQTAPLHAYSMRDICEKFAISRRTFFNWKRSGRLNLKALEIKVGRTIRYQALPIDRVLANRTKATAA